MHYAFSPPAPAGLSPPPHLVKRLRGISWPGLLSAGQGSEKFAGVNFRAGAARERWLRPRVYLSATLALAAGGVAWWSERQADRAYDRYLRAAGQQRQEEQFRRAERYDRMAGAAFAGMEAGIVLTAYLVFF